MPEETGFFDENMLLAQQFGVGTAEHCPVCSKGVRASGAACFYEKIVTTLNTKPRHVAVPILP